MGLLTQAEVRRRLELIFPGTVAHRGHLVRQAAARTILTFLFVGAVGDPDREGARRLRPSMVTWMGDATLARADDLEFAREWQAAAARSQADLARLLAEHGVDDARWYADNSREPIRDEVIRPLNERYGAVLRRRGIAATDASPVLTLDSDFAALFDDGLEEEELRQLIAEWQAAHLDPAEQARLAARRRLDENRDAVVVSLPGRGKRDLPPGTSSIVTTAVLEHLAPRLLSEPYALAICHSRDPVAADDERELSKIGLSLDREVALPDLLLLDAEDGTIWFIEVVVTGGEMNERRRSQLVAWAQERGVAVARCRFVSAYRSRADSIFRRTVGNLAWDTLVWFADEPGRLFRLESLPGSAD